MLFSPLLVQGKLLADPFIFDDRIAFLTATKAQRDTSPYPSSGTFACYPAGDVVDQICGLNSDLMFGSWTDSLPVSGAAEADLSFANAEEFEILLDPQASAFSVGFELEDSEGGSSQSTYTVTLFAGSVEVGRHIFDPTGTGPGHGSPIGKERTFVGFWSEVAFDRVEIRESQTLNEEEYFGPIYVGLKPPPPWQKKYISGDIEELYFGVSLSLDGDRGLIGEYFANNASARTFESGAAYVYDRNRETLNSWRQTQRLEPSDLYTAAAFGASTALWGDLALIAAPFESEPAGNRPNGAGAVYVFGNGHQSPGVWSEVGKIVPPAPSFSFGTQVELRGDLGIVSSTCLNCAGNKVHIYHRNLGGSDAWGRVAEVTAPLASARAVATDGDTLVVGAPSDWNDFSGPYPGAAYVFSRNAGGPNAWGQVAKLEPSKVTAGMGFGQAVDVEGDVILVGAVRYSRSSSPTGAVYAFERNQGGANQWGQTAKLQTDPTDGLIGNHMSFDGEILALSNSRSGRGGVLLYRRVEGGFSRSNRLEAVDGEDGDSFGRVSQSGSVTLVGASFDNDLGLASGSVTFFAPFILGDGFENGGFSKWSRKVKKEEGP